MIGVGPKNVENDFLARFFGEADYTPNKYLYYRVEVEQ